MKFKASAQHVIDLMSDSEFSAVEVQRIYQAAKIRQDRTVKSPELIFGDQFEQAKELVTARLRVQCAELKVPKELRWASIHRATGVTPAVLKKLAFFPNYRPRNLR